MKTKCMSCGGSMKKMQKGGMIKSIIKPFAKKVVKKITKPTTPKMELGGTTTKRIIKKSTGGMYGIPQENLGTSGQYGFAKKGGATGTHKMPNGKTMLNSKMKKGGATKATKFAALAPPYNKATFADRIVGAKKSAKKK